MATGKLTPSSLPFGLDVAPLACLLVWAWPSGLLFGLGMALWLAFWFGHGPSGLPFGLGMAPLACPLRVPAGLVL